MSERVHTCHAECPCQTGGEPTPDFLPVEGSLLPGLLALTRERIDRQRALLQRQDAERAALDEKGLR